MPGYTNDHGFLYACEVKPNESLPDFESPSSQLAAELYHEAASGNLEEVKRLCTAHKLDANNTKSFFEKHSARDYLQHAFQAATDYKQLLVLDYLFELGARPTKRDLGTISNEKHVDLLKLFVKHGVDLDQYVKESLTPFVWAASNEELFDIFDSQGADPNGGAQYAEDWHPLTPLDTAAAKGRFDLVKRLVDRGADVKLSKALIRVVDHADDIGMAKACEMAEYLISLGCNVNQMYDENINYGPGRVLHYAARIKDSEPLIELLIKHGAEPRARSSLNDTPLDWAQEAEMISPRKEELLLGARGGPHVLSQKGIIYQYLGFLPLTGIWDEKGEIKPEVADANGISFES